MQKSQDDNLIHRNIPQLMFYMIMCKVNVLIWGRGTGKSTGPLSDFSLENVKRMPRSMGAIYCNTYIDLLTKIMPAVLEGWEQWGYLENIHFFFGKFAPKRYAWDTPFRTPKDAKHFVHFNNGAGISLISGDKALPNGANFHWGAIDEARLQKWERVREFLLTIRATQGKFNELSCNHSVLFISDMPRDASQNWLLEYEKKMDPNIIEAIIKIQVKLDELQLKLEEANEDVKPAIIKELNDFDRYLNRLRASTVYFSTATTFDNVHALGMDPIKNFFNSLNELDIKTSVLNMKVGQISNGFYPHLDEDHHGYYADNLQYIESLELQNDIRNAGKVKRDSRWDIDVIENAPLDISPDYNNKINCLVIGQRVGRQYRTVNSMYVLAPKYIKDLAKDFSEYYAHHKCKKVNLVHDQTGIAGTARSDFSFIDEWEQALIALGWDVTRVYIGQAPSHHLRYNTWLNLLNPETEKDNDIIFRYNRRNANQMYISMSMAPVKQMEGKYKKDKSSELRDSVKKQEATHFSEAADILMHWVLNSNDNHGYYDVVYSRN